MSTPNNNLPANNLPNRNMSERQREFDELERRRGSWFPFWWVWFLIIVVCFFWFAGWGWNGYGGWWWSRSQITAIPQVSGTGVVVLNSTNKAAFVGQHVNLQNVPIQQKVNDDVFWIGSNSNPMLLILGDGNNGKTSANTNASNNRTLINLRKGDRITIGAQVEKPPATDVARQQWDLTTGGANRMQREQAYLLAQQVSQINRFNR